MSERIREPSRTAEVCLLIKTHALPVLSYKVPRRLRSKVRTGSVVVAPLSGGSHPGVVLSVGGADGRATQDLISVSEDLALTGETVEVCEGVAEASSVALATVLRAALPPKMVTNRYRISSPILNWKEGSFVERRVLKAKLGEDGFRDAEIEGKIEHVVLAPPVPMREWVISTEDSPDFGRARRQREVHEALIRLGGAATVDDLATEDGVLTSALRPLLRSLAARGAIVLEEREEVRAIRISDSSQPRLDLSPEGVSEALSGGVRLWRVPTTRTSEAVGGLAKSVTDSGRSVLVIAPETARAEEIASDMLEFLPAGRRVGVYHSRLEGERAGVWKAARDGELDVLVGTRSAAVIPLATPGLVCVVDEPNPAHRASPGHEGIPIHVREIATILGEVHDIPTVLISSRPSLRAYAPVLDRTLAEADVSEVPPLPDTSWPAVRMVDMRGTGSGLSSTLLDVCEDFLDAGTRIAVVANRLGHTAVVCGGCGSVRSCPLCDVPFILRERLGDAGRLVCGRCGYEEDFVPSCPECGSMRYSKARPSVDSIRRGLIRALDVPVGLITATRKVRANADILVGTAASLLGGGRNRYDLVVLPDADSLLLASWMGSTERAFAGIFSSAESAREMLLVQTMNPENHTLRAAVRGDYRAFAAAELPRLRELGYPPYAHLASLVFDGRKDEVLAAVESHLLPHLGPEVASSELAPGTDGGFRILLRSPDRATLIRTANRVARAFSRLSVGRRVRVGIEIDPEEV